MHLIEDYGIILLDEVGIIQSWNIGAELTQGYVGAEIIGKHFSVLFTPADRAENLPAQALSTALTKG